MIEEYIETEMSKRARVILAKESPQFSLKSFVYNPRLRSYFSQEDGSLKIRDLAEHLCEGENWKIGLCEFCIEINFDKEEYGSLLEEILRVIYRDFKRNYINPEKQKQQASKIYPLMCEDFEIQPNPNFPDW